MITIILYILLTVLTLMYISSIRNTEEFINYRHCDKYEISNRLKNIFKKYKINKSNKNWNLYLPCGYTNVENELKKLEKINKNQYVFAIDGCDKIVSKKYLWYTLKNKYAESYTRYMPKTYDFDKKSIDYLIDNHKNNKKYIVKRDIQQQKGLTIVTDPSELTKFKKKNENIIIQELLTNPFTINGHKINLRIYLLIICVGNSIKSYIHENGFVYYAPKKFNENSNERDVHITTGYIDRKIYEKNPLSIDDFKMYLYKNNYDYKYFSNKLTQFFIELMESIKIPICNNKKFKKGTLYQLFGCDIALDNNLNLKIMEINKGPDLNSKSIRDSQIKDEVVSDLFSTLKLVNINKRNRFIKIN